MGKVYYFIFEVNMNNPIYPCLWLDGNALEVAEYYCSIFPESKILATTPMVVTFEIMSTKYMALNGGAKFKFNESVSFVVECKNQAEIDYYWEKLSYGGEESMCGWLKDRFGVSWQIVPYNIAEIMTNPQRAEKAFPLLMNMRKIDMTQLETV